MSFAHAAALERIRATLGRSADTAGATALRRAAATLTEGRHAEARELLADLGCSAGQRNGLLLGDSPQSQRLRDAATVLRYFGVDAGERRELESLINAAGLRLAESGDLLPTKGRA